MRLARLVQLAVAGACVLALGGWADMSNTAAPAFPVREFNVPAGTHPHDVAPARDGGVWYTAQHAEALGYLDPKTGRTRHIPLGDGSAPHGVIVGPDGAPWITDGGLNAIVRVDPRTSAVRAGWSHRCPKTSRGRSWTARCGPSWRPWPASTPRPWRGT